MVNRRGIPVPTITQHSCLYTGLVRAAQQMQARRIGEILNFPLDMAIVVALLEDLIPQPIYDDVLQSVYDQMIVPPPPCTCQTDSITLTGASKNSSFTMSVVDSIIVGSINDNALCCFRK